MQQRSRRRPRQTPLALTVTAILLGLVGCLPTPDLSDRAEEIAGVLSGMPGVDDVDHSYRNGFDSGQVLDFRVRMGTGAADDEAIDVVTTLNAEVGSEFADYSRGLTLGFEDFTADIRGVPDADQLRPRLVGMKRLNASLHPDHLSWQIRNDTDMADSLDVRGMSADADTAVSAVRAVVGRDRVQVTVAPHRQAAWTVMFPYSAQEQNRLAGVLRPSIPEVEKVEISDDRLNSVTARLEAGTDAASRLMTIIDRIDAGTSQPWTLSWTAGQPTHSGSGLATGATVSVGGCDYVHDSKWEREPDEYYTPSALAVRDQLRGKYDTCG